MIRNSQNLWLKSEQNGKMKSHEPFTVHTQTDKIPHSMQFCFLSLAKSSTRKHSSLEAVSNYLLRMVLKIFLTSPFFFCLHHLNVQIYDRIEYSVLQSAYENAYPIQLNRLNINTCHTYVHIFVLRETSNKNGKSTANQFHCTIYTNTRSQSICSAMPSNNWSKKCCRFAQALIAIRFTKIQTEIVKLLHTTFCYSASVCFSFICIQSFFFLYTSIVDTILSNVAQFKQTIKC